MRRVRPKPSVQPPADLSLDMPEKTKTKKIIKSTNAEYYFIFVLAFLFLVSLLTRFVDEHLPEANLINTKNPNNDKFIAERAKDHVDKLTSIGPRVSGSYENEVLAINYLKNAITKIINKAKSNYSIEVSVERHSGSYSGRMTNVYRNVPNIAVKLGPNVTNKPDKSLLLNCHFDTVVSSPGGSDDAAACAVLLEILGIISQSSTINLKHNIIFLFNGAEENFLQASHGFVTNHRWMKEIKAFINLESCGAGGREHLFQAGPKSSWMIKAYAKVAPFPYASSTAQEIFQSGLVPSDTDFRIFQHFGNITGLDFAWSKNGYVYHTKYDSSNQIPLGMLQRTGDNFLALIREIVSNDFEINDDNDIPVYFDVMGFFVLHWSLSLADVINYSNILLGIFSIFLNIKASQEMSLVTYLTQFIISIGMIFCSWMASLATASVIAIALTTFSKSMSWYGHPGWLFFLYVCPTITVSMFIIMFVGNYQNKTVKSTWTLFYIYCDAYLAIIMIALLMCTLKEIRSGFIPLFWIIFPALGNIFRQFFLTQWKDWKLISYHVGVLTIPYAQSFYLVLSYLHLFIPIMGRFGAATNSELYLGMVTAIFCCWLLNFMMPIVLLTKKPVRALSVFIGLFLFSIVLLFLTPLGFPYSGNVTSPTPQRFFILHTQRVYHDVKGNIQDSSTGYWIIDSDINSPHSVKLDVPEINSAVSSEEDCNKRLFCGLPYRTPISKNSMKTTWIPGPGPSLNSSTNLELISKRVEKDFATFTFNITGPDHIGIMISPYEGVELVNWSASNDRSYTIWKNRKVYYIFYACASDCLPYILSIDLRLPGVKGPENRENLLVTVALAGHFMHGQHQQSLIFKEFLMKFPAWTAITSWTASYSSWEF